MVAQQVFKLIEMKEVRRSYRRSKQRKIMIRELLMIIPALTMAKETRSYRQGR